MDAIITYQVYEKELAYLENNKKERNGLPNLYDYYFNEVIPTLNMYIDIEMNGIYVDWERMKGLVKQYQVNIAKVESEIYAFVGKKFNISSPEALGFVLKNDCKLPDLGQTNTTKKGEVFFKANEECLNEWERQGYKIATLLKRWRELDTMINMFIGDKVDSLDKGYWRYKDDNGFIHPTYQVMLADSGRLKCSEPNAQQCPKQGAEAKDFRMVFQPPTNIEDWSEMSSEAVQVEMDNGETLELLPDVYCFVKRNGEEVKVFAKDMQEGDEFLAVL